MFKNHFLLAVRVLWKNRLFTFLNVAGLAGGLAVALLLIVYVIDERTFDQFHSKADHIYRVDLLTTFGEERMHWGSAPNAIGPTMDEQIPQVEGHVRLLKHNFGQTAFVRVEEQNFAETLVYWADPGLFEVFDVPLLMGDPKTALSEPNQVVISASVAQRYFGGASPLGKPLVVDQSYNMVVTGVYEDFPGNSSLDAALFGSFSSVRWARNPTWGNASFETYLLLVPGSNPADVDVAMKQILDANVPPENQWYQLQLKPLLDIHLGSEGITNSYVSSVGDPAQVRLVFILALVVLGIAAINYMNLATARAQLRFKEVAMNKVVGAHRGHLAARFYLETLLVVAVALLGGYALVAGLLPMFNQLTGKAIDHSVLFQWDVAALVLGVGAVVWIVAGSYPALYMSSFAPKRLLHTTFTKQSGAGLFRRGLVVVQFTASVVLIIGTIVVYQQMQYIQTHNLGFASEQVVAVTTAGARQDADMAALMNEMQNVGGVSSVCRAQSFPCNGGSGRTLGAPLESEKTTFIQTNRISADCLDVLGVNLIAGTTVSDRERTPTDTLVQLVLNRTAVSFMGFEPLDVIGRQAPNVFGDLGVVVGVVDDFHFDSFRSPITAYAFHNNNSELQRYMLVRVETGDVMRTMKDIEATFLKHIPYSAFEYTFASDRFDKLYRSEQRTASVVFWFSILTIFIACLGLFGLAAFSAEQRTREIGIRKVLGARVDQIAGMITADFLKLVGIGVVLAIPLGWWGMSVWLQDFSYRISMSWWIFALAALAAVVIALLTVGMQAVRAASMDPVRSLRSE